MLQVVSELVTEGPAEDLSKLTVPLLQQRLSSLGLPASGRKAALILRLQTRGPAAGAQPSTANRDAADAQAEEWEDVSPASGSYPSGLHAEEADPAANSVAPRQMFSDAAQRVADSKPKRARRGGRKKQAPGAAGAAAEGGGMEVDMEASAAAELAAEGIELEQAGAAPGPAPATPPDVRPGTGALDDVMSAEVSGCLAGSGMQERCFGDCCCVLST